LLAYALIRKEVLFNRESVFALKRG